MSAIDRTNPLPLWAQLLTILRERIASGSYDAGFPTDEQLSREFALSRHTVREAVRRLQDEGVLQRRRGIGTSVTPRTIEQPCGALYSLFRSIEAQGREQGSDVLSLAITRDEVVAARLGLGSKTAMVRLERLRRIDGTPLAHDIAWLPADLARPLLEVDFSRTGLYDELAAIGQSAPDAGSEWIRPVVPDQRERRLLGVPAREAIYRIERLGTVGGRPVEWRESFVRADHYTFVAHWSATTRYEPTLAPT